jgi:hypothetical protein
LLTALSLSKKYFWQAQRAEFFAKADICKKRRFAPLSLASKA